MEKDIRIKLDEQFSTYGRLFGSLDKPLVILVHGLPGGYREGFYMAAARWFAKNGYSAFGFGLYGYRQDMRQLIDCTLATHAADLDAVVKYFRKKGVKKIFVAGHSFGGPTILLSKEQDFDAATLWDPSHDISFTKKNYGCPAGKFIKEVNGYLMHWGGSVVIGKAMAQEVDRLKWHDLPKKFHKPLQMIVAGKGVLVPAVRRSIKNAHAPKAIDIIKGATHYFDDTEGMQEEVFASAKAWFDKY